jgi:D-alanyl-D-alanine dipeptidase
LAEADDRSAPIQHVDEPPNWGRLPIVECGEPLVPLEATGRLRVRALYAEQGIPGAPTTTYVRAGVRDRLLRAVAALPDGVALVVFDGYRPLNVQAYLWDDFRARLAAEHPEWDGDALDRATGQFVARPVADPLRPPPHRTGGAVDVYLIDAATGAELPMGTEADEVAPASATRYFEEHPEEPFTGNRRTLYHAMSRAGGFANYPGEWWHFDFGNQRWANLTGAPHALYGLPAAEP